MGVLVHTSCRLSPNYFWFGPCFNRNRPKKNIGASTIAASIVHSKLDYCNSLYYNLRNLKLTASSRFRTVLHVLWLKPLNLLLLHLSSDLCTGSRSTNALNINSFHLPIKFLQPANLTIYTILGLSLFSLQVEPAPHLLSP